MGYYQKVTKGALPDVVLDPVRVDAVQRAAEVASRQATGLARLTALAARLLRVEVGFLSLVGAEHEVLTAVVGDLGALVPQSVPVEQSACVHLVASGEPLLVDDLGEHPVLRDLAEVRALGLRSYAGSPVADQDGRVLGGFCVGSTGPRRWTAADAALLADLAAAVSTELQLRVTTDELRRVERKARRRAEEQAALHRVASSVARGATLNEVLVEVAAAVAALLEVSVALVLRFPSDAEAEVAARAAADGATELAGVGDCGEVVAQVRDTGEAALSESGDVPCAAVPIRLRGRTWGVVVVRTPERTSGRTLTQLRQLGDLIAVVVENTETREQLVALARTDPLTGAGNRRALDEALDGELARSRRHGHPLMLALLDVDHFKRVNDEEGHEAGDRVLRELTSRMRDELRSADLLARVGGDEFALLLPETSAAAWAAVLDRVRSAVAARPVGGVPVTITAGAAAAGASAEAEHLYRTADAALYRAKSAQRGSYRVVDVAPAPRRALDD